MVPIAQARHASSIAGTAQRLCIVLTIAALASVVGGCAGFAPPRPWEKGDLARPAMRFDTDVLAAKSTRHVYQSKEGASAGGSVGGGGCGCN